VSLADNIDFLKRLPKAGRIGGMTGHARTRLPARSPLVEVRQFGTNPGALRMFAFVPDNLQQPRALVVVLHGCDGVGRHYREWALELASWGYVALLVDSFRPRGFARHPHLPALSALTLLSAALTAALFLLVLLLVEGWRLEPLAAAVIVSVMPAAAFAAPRLGLRGPVAEAGVGSLLVAGGLLALGLLPGASPWWTVPPQILIGLGLGLAVTALTHAALAGRSPQAIHGGWTIAARHLGVVLGLIVLVPIFQADLDHERNQALQAGTAIVLDANVSPSVKIGVARDVVAVVDAADRRIPDINKAFAHRKMTPALEAVRSGLLDELDRAATHAFSRSFLAAAALALLSLIVVLVGRREIEL